MKLGTTTDLITRLQSLQTSNCPDLHVRAVWPGNGVDEKALHRRFAHVHLAREWFAFTPELDEFIRERAAAAPPALQQL